MNGRIMSGGSTLTMQVARLLEDGPTGAWRGKLRQMQLAWALERRLSKDEILALYLNRAPYGGNLEGVRSATRAWFGKEPALRWIARRDSKTYEVIAMLGPKSPSDRSSATTVSSRISDAVVRRSSFSRKTSCCAGTPR